MFNIIIASIIMYHVPYKMYFAKFPDNYEIPRHSFCQEKKKPFVKCE